MAFEIPLTVEEMAKCRDFAIGCGETHQHIEFGQGDTQPRAASETARDIIIGKLGEVAFAKWFAANHGIELVLDFENYGAKVWDKADAEYRGFRIDVKASRQGAKWLLLDINKIIFRAADNQLPHILVFLTTGWNRNADKPTGMAYLHGYAFLPDMRLSEEGAVHMPKGSKIPGTQTVLQAENVGRRVENLFTNWDAFEKVLKEGEPFDTTKFTPFDAGEA
jgi:hypothetical protein